jgi:capsular polysaccharide biosynthesis protein
MEEEINLIEIFSVFKKWWKFIVGVSIIVSVIAGVILLFQPKTYQSYSILKIGIVGGKPLESVSEMKQIMSSQYICKKILKKLNLPSTDKNLVKMQDIFKFGAKDRLLTIKTKGGTPEEAFKYVKVITNILMDRHTEIYKKEREKLFESMSILKKEMAPLPLTTSINDFSSFIRTTTIEIPPQKVEIPLPRKRRKTVLITFFLTLIVTSLTSFLIEGVKKKS